MTRALDRQKHFVHLPLVTGPGAATELISILLAKLATPLANGFIGHDHAAFTQQLFDIAEAQAEPEVQPYRVADDFDRKPVILIFGGGGRCVHAATLPCNKGTRQVDNARPRPPSSGASPPSRHGRNSSASTPHNWCGEVLYSALR